jgi:hypothetical protein
LEVEREIEALQDWLLEADGDVGVLDDDGRDLQVVADPYRQTCVCAGCRVYPSTRMRRWAVVESVLPPPAFR